MNISFNLDSLLLINLIVSRYPLETMVFEGWPLKAQIILHRRLANSDVSLRIEKRDAKATSTFQAQSSNKKAFPTYISENGSSLETSLLG
jgi:hypothetical protein